MQCNAYKDGRCAVRDADKVDCNGIMEICGFAGKLVDEMDFFNEIWTVSHAEDGTGDGIGRPGS